jgi:putative copper export protein
MVARFTYCAAALLCVVLGVTAFIGTLQPPHAGRMESADPIAYGFALILSVPPLVLGLLLWLRARYWRRSATRFARRDYHG